MSQALGRVVPNRNSENAARLPLLPHPLDQGATLSRVTRREQYLRAFSAAVRSKADWTSKILDDELFKKWVREAIDITRTENTNEKIVCWYREDVQFVRGELIECYKPFVEKAGENGIHPVIDCVWKADGFIDEELRQDLIHEVSFLENVPEDQKDWHPGSNNQVLDLIHPSLYPLVYHRSLNAITGDVICPPVAEEEFLDLEASSVNHAVNDYEVDGSTPSLAWSREFQWLPSDFTIDISGKTKISSYINNLDQKSTYPVLERIFDRFVPMFNYVLGDLAVSRHQRRRVSEENISYEAEEYLTAKEVVRLDALVWEPLPNDKVAGKDKVEDEEGETEYEKWDLGDFNGDRWSAPDVTPEIDIRGKTVKVIVKLANIVLTPENTHYDGGSWHVEAMLNERIVATGIYYYSQENITASTLSFRQVSVPFDENVRGEVARAVFDMEWEGESVQEVGTVDTKENRAIVFPNVLQHKVSPFDLIDPSKPGYRKILCFFLVDPSEAGDHVVTTSSVVPQQLDNIAKRMASIRYVPPFGKLPEELFQMIVEYLPEGFTREEAEEFREKLIAERSMFNKWDAKVAGWSYNLCEH